MNTPGDPLRGLRERKERIERERAPKVAPSPTTRVRKTYNIPAEVQERMDQILAFLKERADPGLTNHAIVVMILDQVSQAILAGEFPLEVTQVVEQPTTIRLP